MVADGLDSERSTEEGCKIRLHSADAQTDWLLLLPLQSAVAAAAATDRPKLQGCKSPFSSFLGWPTQPTTVLHSPPSSVLRSTRDGDNDSTNDATAAKIFPRVKQVDEVLLTVIFPSCIPSVVHQRINNCKFGMDF